MGSKSSRKSGTKKLPTVEQEKTKKVFDKETKLKVADMFVKVLVPRLKSGTIGSKQIFKILARELTHRVLSKRGANINLEEVENMTSKFFTLNENILTENDAKVKPRLFSV